MDNIILTEEQKTAIINKWNSLTEPPSVQSLVGLIFGGGHDEHSEQSKVVREFLATRNLVPRCIGPGRESLAPRKKDKKLPPLTEEQKTYISNNAISMSSTEMARVLFNNPRLNPLYGEVRLVNDYIKTLDVEKVYDKNEENDIPKGDWKPPVTFEQVFRRVNQYINYQLDKDKITPKQKRDLEKLVHYLHTHRLIKQINNYTKESDRRSFEDAFIRYTYDKPDLTQEEVDQYILLSHEAIISFNTQQRIEQLQGMLKDTTEAQHGDDYIKISMSLVEAIGKAQDEYNACVKRQHQFLDDLKEKRSKRLSKEIQENASILNLVNLWKDEEGRKELLGLAKKEQEAVAKEVDRLSSLPDIKCRILGLTKEEILNG